VADQPKTRFDLLEVDDDKPQPAAVPVDDSGRFDRVGEELAPIKPPPPSMQQQETQPTRVLPKSPKQFEDLHRLHIAPVSSPPGGPKVYDYSHHLPKPPEKTGHTLPGVDPGYNPVAKLRIYDRGDSNKIYWGVENQLGKVITSGGIDLGAERTSLGGATVPVINQTHVYDKKLPKQDLLGNHPHWKNKMRELAVSVENAALQHKKLRDAGQLPQSGPQSRWEALEVGGRDSRKKAALEGLKQDPLTADTQARARNLEVGGEDRSVPREQPLPKRLPKTDVAGVNYDAYDYSHQLPPEARSAGYQLIGLQNPPGRQAGPVQTYWKILKDGQYIDSSTTSNFPTMPFGKLRGIPITSAVEAAIKQHQNLLAQGNGQIKVPEFRNRWEALELSERLNLLRESLKKAMPKLLPPASQPQQMSPWDETNPAPAAKPVPSRASISAASWAGKPIAHPSHADTLAQDAVINEFGPDKLPRQQAEAKAYEDYVRQQHAEAAAWHLSGMKAAHAGGDLESAKKHSLMYQLHSKKLSHDPVGPAHPMVTAHMSKSPKPQRFKAHRGDLFALQPDPDQIVASSPPYQMGKSEVLHKLYQALKKSVK
jgi:hypothetical protein